MLLDNILWFNRGASIIYIYISINEMLLIVYFSTILDSFLYFQL